MFFAINNALKTNKGYILDRFGLVAAARRCDNFVQAWTRSHLDEYFLNSVIVTVGAVLLLLVVSSLAGFALAILRFPYRKFIFVVILASLMIPVQVVLVPFYQTIHRPRPAQHPCRADHLLHGVLPAVLRLPDDGVLLRPAARADRGGADRRRQAPAGLVARDAADGEAGADHARHPQHALLLERRADLAAGAAEGAHADGRHSRAARGVHRPTCRCCRPGIVLAAAPIVIIYIIFQRQIVSGIAVGAVKG